MSHVLKTGFALTLLASLNASASANFQGQVTEYRTPMGVTERCTILTPIPGGDFSNGDRTKEREYCAIDLNGPETAMCPKNRSTSPGTFVVSLQGLGVTPAAYEANGCSNGRMPVIVKFKNTMEHPTTSSTFSQSPLLYYQFSRYFETTLEVPVAVARTISRTEHRARVSMRSNGIGRMNRAAWSIMRDAEANPAAYSPTSDLFTDDRSAIYGVLLNSPGDMYGAEINGASVDGLRAGQLEIQTTPPFVALKSSSSLESAIAQGIASIAQSSVQRAAHGANTPSAAQMIYWMRELSEMSILDHLFNQQDRPMNIDFNWKWTYVKDGEVESDRHRGSVTRARMHTVSAPAEIAGYRPQLLQRTTIADNDAGGRASYSNLARSTGMVTALRHISAKTYRKAIQLDRDFRAHGPLYAYLTSTFGLASVHTNKIISNAAEIAQILSQNCRAGLLHFDLEPKQFMKTGVYSETTVSCDNP